MRPVNLLPSEDRRQKAADISTSSMAYMLIGALALGLAAVTLLVLTNNKVADRKAEVSNLQQQEAEAQARAQQFASFTSFDAMEQARRQTVESLADSRFDWERVMNELARVIPSDVWLVELRGAASATSGASGDSASTSTLEPGSILGPSLQLSGCADGQDAVAGFLAALRDIDGVTRVGLSSSERPTGDAGGGTGGAGAGNTECRTRDFITKFDVVAAFDEAPVPATGAAPTTPTTPAPTTPPESAPATGSETGAETTPATDTGS